MFTGIIETIGIVDSIIKRGNNLDITIMSSISKVLQQINLFIYIFL